MPDNAMSVTTRPIVSDDEVFLLAVYACTRAEEMALVPWTDAQREAFLRMQSTAQKEFYLMKFPYASFELILLDSTPVGRLYLAKGDHEIRILDITLLPEYRGRGIGSPIIKRLMAEGEATGRPVRIYVDGYSPSLRLFERLGFSPIGQYGTSLQMEWKSHKEASGVSTPEA